LLWTLWPRVGPFSTDKGEPRRRSLVEVIQRIGTIVAMLLITVISVPPVFAIATFPGERLEDRLSSFQPLAPLREWLVAGEVDFATRKPTSWWSNRLVLPGLDAIDHTKLDTEAKIAAATETVSLRARHLEGAVLIGAVLRKADLTAAYLERADLTTADLRDAKLGCPGLVESRSGLSVSLQPGKRTVCTQLQGGLISAARSSGGRHYSARSSRGRISPVRCFRGRRFVTYSYGEPTPVPLTRRTRGSTRLYPGRNNSAKTETGQ